MIFLYFDFNIVNELGAFERHAFVYDVSGETRIENVKIPYSDFVGNVLPEGSITQLGDVTGPIGDSGAPLLVNSAGDALEFGNELLLADISANDFSPTDDNVNSIIAYELDYNLENYRGRSLYIRVNVDPTPDEDPFSPNPRTYRTWVSWTKRVSEVADLREDGITTLVLETETFEEHDLFLLSATLRSGNTAPVSLFRRADNTSGNTVLALGFHTVDTYLRNVGFWII